MSSNKRTTIIILLVAIILLSSFFIVKTLKTKKIEESEVLRMEKALSVRGEVNIIFEDFLSSIFQPSFVEMKNPHQEELMGMEACGEEGCSGEINTNIYGSYWEKDSKEFYGGIEFKPDSQKVNQYQASVGWYEFLELNEDKALELINSYFKILPENLKCEEKTEENITYKECKVQWQDFQKNENGLIVTSMKGVDYGEGKKEMTFIYFCSVPSTGELYNKKSCLENE